MIGILNRKESIILTAIEIIDEIGLQGLSTREIAKRQGVSEGALFRHFKSKNDIIDGVLDHFTKYDGDIVSSIEVKKLKPMESILYFITIYATYYQSDPAIIAVDQIYGVLSYEPKFSEKIKDVVVGRLAFLQKVIEEGQKMGEISTKINSKALADMILGTFQMICFRWKMSGRGFSLKEDIIMTVGLLIDTFRLNK